MKDNLDLLFYERNLIDNGLQIMITQNVKISVQSTDRLTEMYYKDLNTWLFELLSKVKSSNLDAYVDLSFNEINMIKSGLTLLDELTYGKSLEETEKDKAQSYADYKLKMTALREKISNIESYKMYGAHEKQRINSRLLI